MSTADVLLVEDDPDVRQATALLLEDGGLSVRLAIHGADALDALRSGFRPRVILLDLMMPVMDGMEFLQHLAASEPELARLPVVVMTASLQPVVPGSRAIVRKPYDIDDLIKTVRRFAG